MNFPSTYKSREKEENCKQLSLPKTTAAYQKILIFHISSFESHHLQWQTAEYDWVRERGILRAYTASYDLQYFWWFFSWLCLHHPHRRCCRHHWLDMSTWTSLTFYCHMCVSWQEVKIIKILNNLTPLDRHDVSAEALISTL